MPTLHLICGLPCSGKTTLAKQLEQDLSALRLTPDEWMNRVVDDGYDEDKRAIVEAMLMEVAVRVLELGVDVILDFGFWGHDERQGYRKNAEKVGAQTKIHYLDVPLTELLQRLDARNAALPPDTFHIPRADLELWWTLFERPTAKELA